MNTATSPSIILIVACGLLVFALSGLVGTFYLILVHAEGALIAIISGPTVTALGGLMSMLNNTRTLKPEKNGNGNPPGNP